MPGGITMRTKVIKSIVFISLVIIGTQSLLISKSLAQEEESDPPEIAIGERLFLETRFAQFFFEMSKGDANHNLDKGDPVMGGTETLGEPLPGPFAGQSMNCRGCHFVDEHLDAPGGGMRTYTDFARRSPVPARPKDFGGDGATHAPRNSPPLVNASLPRPNGVLFHFDAEFLTMEDLVIATLTGRNYGWLSNEFKTAIQHVAHIIRNDAGMADLAKEFGGAYKEVLKGNPRDENGDLIEDLVLPVELQIDVEDPATTDEDILNLVAKIIAAYVTDLMFSQDDNGEFNLSPYDVFLQLNGLDRNPKEGESDLEYSRRLLTEIKNLSEIKYVQDPENGIFAFHEQDYVFGPEELRGLKLFFNEKNRNHHSSGAGNCVSCHAAPNFTDFNFHNTGSTQKEFDGIHGNGSFRKLWVPGLNKRLKHPNRYLPPTPKHPNASGKFKSIPSTDNKHIDLGLWNVFANPDFPKPQVRIFNLLCEKELGTEPNLFLLIQTPRKFIRAFQKCRFKRLLPKTIALFKTPGLRDLGHSAPFMHTGQEDTLEDVIRFYIDSSQLARRGALRNGAKELKGIRLREQDVIPLVKFLEALNEDYE